jgi:hypothetical protein
MNDFAWKQGPLVFADGHAFLTRPPELQELEEPLSKLAWLQRHVYWWIGDTLLTGEKFFGDEMYQIVDPDISADLLQRCVAVSAKFPMSQRNTNLSWSHHLAVIKLDPRIRVVALKKAETERWTSQELQKYVRSKWGKQEMLDQFETSPEEDSAGSQG